MTAPDRTHRDTDAIAIDLVRKHQIWDAGDVIARSLLVEPGFCALVPDEKKRFRMMLPLMTGVVNNARRYRSCYVAMEGTRIVGVAVWLPPGSYPFSFLTNLRMLPALRGMIGLGREISNQIASMEKNAETSFPKEPVWYLQAFGVAPSKQGQGIGTTLIQPHLDRMDREALPCYLETGTAANVRFYERAGFQVREAAIHLVPPELGVTHWTMFRPAATQ